MRKITLLLLVIATASLTGAVAKGKKCEAQKAKYVVLIGSDGFSSDVVRAHPGAFPNIEALMKNGSYTLERRSVLPSSSAVNWASMLMGDRAGTARLYDMGQSGSRPAVARDR